LYSKFDLRIVSDITCWQAVRCQEDQEEPERSLLL
jgi:hypothetical protein